MDDREVAASKQRKDVFARVSSFPMLVQMHEEVSVALLGILTGAMLAAVTLVSIWQGVEPGVVQASFVEYSARVNSLLMPLSLITLFTVAITAAAMWFFSAPNRGWFYAATGLAAVVLALHPLYFAHASDALEATAGGGAVAAERVTEVLSSWRNTQWVRFALSVLALIAGIRGLRAADLSLLAARTTRPSGMHLQDRTGETGASADVRRPHPRPAMR